MQIVGGKGDAGDDDDHHQVVRGVGREFAASGGKEADKQVGFTVDVHVCVFFTWMRQSFPNPVLVPVSGGQNLIAAVAVQASGARWQIHHFHKS